MFKKLITVLFLMPCMSKATLAQSFINDGVNAALETVQQGLDLIWPDTLALEDVNARIGVGMGVTPDYVGSNNYRFRLVPLIDIRYKDDWRLNGSLLTFTALRSGNIEAGPLLNLRFGRSMKSNKALVGLGDIKTTFQLGGFISYKTDSALLSIDYRHGTGAGIGSSVRITAGHGVYKSPDGNFVAMLGARARWLSKKSMQTEFGLTPRQSQNSAYKLPAFATDAGLPEASINLVGAYKINERTRLLGLISYGRLFGQAKESPLVANGVGSATQFVGGTGLAFTF